MQSDGPTIGRVIIRDDGVATHLIVFEGAEMAASIPLDAMRAVRLAARLADIAGRIMARSGRGPANGE